MAKADHSRQLPEKPCNGGKSGDGGNRTHATFPATYLDALASAVYTALELVSHVPAASLGQHVTHGKPGHKILSLTDEPAHLEFRRRYDNCRTDESRKTVIAAGLDAIKTLRYSRRPSVDCQTLEGRLHVGRDTRPAEIVAHAYGYSIRHVYRLRDEARRYDQRNTRNAA